MFIRSVSHPLPEAPWQQAPLLRYALLMMVGIAAAWSLRDVVTGQEVLCACGLCGLIACVAWLIPRKGKNMNVAIGASSLTLTLAAGALTLLEYERTVTDWPSEPDIWQAEVEKIHKRYENGVSVDLQLFNAPKAFDGKKIRVRLAGENATTLTTGNRLAFHARIALPKKRRNPGDFDYAAYLVTHGFSGTAFVNDSSWVKMKSPSADRLSSRLSQYREKLLEQYSTYFEEEDFEILAALTLGDKSTLQTETRDLFADTGTSHILALSGLHLSIIFCLLHFFFLRGLHNRKLVIGTTLFVLGAIWIFVYMAGAPLSLLRAATMLTLLQIGLAFQRTRNASLNNLAFAAIILLGVSPLALFDIGFQLSFAAVLSILLCSQYVWRRIPLPEWEDREDLKWLENVEPSNRYMRRKLLIKRWRQTLTKHSYLFFKNVLLPFLTVSLSAQWGTAGLVLYYFHSFTPYVCLANFIVIPAAYMLLGGALLFFLLPFTMIQETIASFLHIVMLAMRNGLEGMSHWPGAKIEVFPSVWTLVLLTLIPLTVYLFATTKNKKKRVRWIYATALLALLSMGSEAWRISSSRISPQIAVYDIPQATVIHFVTSTERSYLFSSLSKDSTEQKLQYLERNYFTPHDFKAPKWVEKSSYQDKELIRQGDFFVFGSGNILLLRRRIGQMHRKRPISVQTLLVARGCRDSLKTVRRIFRPERVVLDGTLSTYWRKKWKRDCEKQNIPCHDIREQGAFIFKLQ